MHRRCILASFQPHSLCAGQSFFVQGPCLQIGNGPIIDLHQATGWEPLALGLGPAEPLAMVKACVRRLLAALPIPNSTEGLGQAIPLISAIADEREVTSFRPGSLIAQAHGLVIEMARACIGRDMAQVAWRSRELVGLGPGLTPSGDDFLGGLLFAAHSLKMAYPGDFHWEQEPITDLMDWARTQTHPISHAILSDLALGHGPEPLHAVVTSLLNGKDPDRVMADVTRLLGIGDTSGWDILAGVLTGMLLVAGKGNGKRMAKSKE